MKRILMTVALALFAPGLFAQSADVLMGRYEAAGGYSGRLEFVRGIADGEGPGAPEFYARALRRLLSDYPGLRDGEERAAAAGVGRVLAERIGDAGYAPAAADLSRLVEGFSDPLARGAALIALGKLHEATGDYYLGAAAGMLDALNNNPPAEDRQGAEQLALRLVIALEQYGNAAGYIPVFAAADPGSWYSETVRGRAMAALPRISEDPSEPLLRLIRGVPYTAELKLAALRSLEAAPLPAARKSEAAVAAYAEGWRALPADSRQRARHAALRKFAQRMIWQHGAEDPLALRLLERSYREGIDAQERHNAVNAIASLAARGHLEEQAVDLLGSFLLGLNGKCADGSLGPSDEAMVRVVIPALGSTRSQRAARPLNTVQGVPWTNAVKRLARTALNVIAG